MRFYGIFRSWLRFHSPSFNEPVFEIGDIFHSWLIFDSLLFNGSVVELVNLMIMEEIRFFPVQKESVFTSVIVLEIRFSLINYIMNQWIFNSWPIFKSPLFNRSVFELENLMVMAEIRFSLVQRIRVWLSKSFGNVWDSILSLSIDQCLIRWIFQ